MNFVSKINLLVFISITQCITLNTWLSEDVQAQNKIEWHSFEDAIQIADSTNKPIFVDVWAPWCGWCHKMNREVYPATQKTLTQNFVLTKLNREDNKTLINYRGRKFSSLKLAQYLNTETVPAIVILSPNGDYLTDFSGYIEADNLTTILDYITHKKFSLESSTD